MPVPVPVIADRRPEGVVKPNKVKYLPLLPDEITSKSIVSPSTKTNTSASRSQPSSTHINHSYRLAPITEGLGHTGHCNMHRNGSATLVNGAAHTVSQLPGTIPLPAASGSTKAPLIWDWDVEHEDRRREAQADAAHHGAQPFQVDRRVLKDVVREKMDCEVGKITFLSSGTFHKAYLVTLTDTRELVARVARRFMPRLKTESEVATMQYLRDNTSVPVPFVHHYDSNPYNRLGGEYILMSKAPGIPLSRVYYSLSNDELKTLFTNIASVMIPLFGQRFSHLGSLYIGGSTNSVGSSASPTPTATHSGLNGFPFTPLFPMTNSSTIATPKPLSSLRPRPAAPSEYHVGPIVSWPFFGSNRGDLSHPKEINRGPWTSTHSYLASCVEREVSGAIRENEGKSAPHRLHLDPDEIRSSRHHHLNALPDDMSDDSDEWDAQESEEEWEGPGDAMYRDYRRMQRSTFLVAHTMRREDSARREMGRWMRVMERLGANTDHDGVEEFGLDCHDLSLENIFVDEHDHTKITCVLDWESTTTRPLWASAHLPAFLQSSPFTARMFREAVAKLAETRPSLAPAQPGKKTKTQDTAVIAKEWLHYEAAGARLRMAHRCAEWDGWEEGLVDSILGPEETEDEWFKEADSAVEDSEIPSVPVDESILAIDSEQSSSESASGVLLVASLKRRKHAGRITLKKEKEKEQMLDTTGDICGGRGGELGRRLEEWLSVTGSWDRKSDDSEEYDAGEE